ncbi:MAG: hypothetical protein QM652_01675 [Legionella sp.]|uniref:hypothetical protein n=1 Tax=Legionella sp. TaxID=459 RepID=UPI0039E2D1EC
MVIQNQNRVRQRIPYDLEFFPEDNYFYSTMKHWKQANNIKNKFNKKAKKFGLGKIFYSHGYQIYVSNRDYSKWKLAITNARFQELLKKYAPGLLNQTTQNDLINANKEADVLSARIDCNSVQTNLINTEVQNSSSEADTNLSDFTELLDAWLSRVDEKSNDDNYWVYSNYEVQCDELQQAKKAGYDISHVSLSGNSASFWNVCNQNLLQEEMILSQDDIPIKESEFYSIRAR